MKYIFFLFILLPSALYAQKQGQALPLAGQAYIDSLLQELPKAKEDTNKVILLYRISFSYHSRDTREGIKNGEKALALAEKLNWKKGLAYACNAIGLNYQNLDNNKALEYYLKGLKVDEELGNTKRIARGLVNIGSVYYFRGSFSEACDCLLKALKLFEEINDKDGIASTLGDIGNIYLEENNYTKSLQYFSLSLKVSRELGDKEEEALLTGNIGNVYIHTGEYDSALQRYHQALEMYEASGDKNGISRNLNNIGIVYSDLKENYKALAYTFKALKILEETDNKNEIGFILRNIGEYYLNLAKGAASLKPDSLVPADKKNCLKLAINYTQKSITIAQTNNNLTLLSTGLKNLADAQTTAHSYKEALKSYKQYESVKDSIYDTENKLKIANIENKQELGRKEIQIEILAQANNVKDLRAEKEKLTRKILIGGIVLILVVAFSVVLHYVRKQKSEKLIAGERINTLLKEQELRSVSNMLEVQENERKRIATDLHDRLGSMLSTVKLYFNLVEEQVDKLKEQNKEQFHKAFSLLDDACNEVRKISHDLVSGELVKFGLVSALSQMKETIKNTGKLEMNILAFGMEGRLDSSVETTLYRIVQELVNNILKHSEATEVTIQLNKAENNLNIVIEDNGSGFDAGAAMAQDGMGLKNIETRVKKLNGIISIDSGKGRGTTTIIDIPV